MKVLCLGVKQCYRLNVGSPQSESESRSVVPNSLWPHGLYSPEYSRPEYLEWVVFSFLQGILPTQGSNLRSPTLQADSLPVEPQGKPKNTGVGSLSLLQRTFPTQESNWGLLHCRCMSYQGSPYKITLNREGTDERDCKLSSAISTSRWPTWVVLDKLFRMTQASVSWDYYQEQCKNNTVL